MDFVRLRKTLNFYVEILKNAGTHQELQIPAKNSASPLRPPTERSGRG